MSYRQPHRSRSHLPATPGEHHFRGLREFADSASDWKATGGTAGLRLAAGDLFGGSVAISGTTAVVGETSVPGERAYVFTKTASGWKQTAELKGSGTVTDGLFGLSVAISGTTAVVGANGHAKAGRAYVFIETTTGWHQVAELKGSDAVVGDDFGSSVAISGTTAIVGANGHAKNTGRVYVFEA